MTADQATAIVTSFTAPNLTRVAVVRFQGRDYTVRQTPKKVTTIWLGSVRITKKDQPNAWHKLADAAFAEWEAPGSQPGVTGPSPEAVATAVAQLQKELTAAAPAISRIMAEPLPGEEDAPGLTVQAQRTIAARQAAAEKLTVREYHAVATGTADEATAAKVTVREAAAVEAGEREEANRAHYDEVLSSAPVLALRLAADAAWEEEAHAAGFATGDDYASFLTEDLDADAAEDPAYPPYTTEEAEQAAAEGLNLYAPQGGSYSHEVATRDGRYLGRVRCVTETMGNGFWVRFAAYRPDGSRIGYSRTRVGAATLLVRPERGNTFWVEQEKAAQAALTPAAVTFTNPELWG